MKNQKLYLYSIVAVTLLALIVWGTTMATSPITQGLARIGNRYEFPTLPRDNVTYMRLFKNKSNKVFLRFIIQKPPRESLHSFTYVAYVPKNEIKAVHFVVSGKTMSEKPATRELRNIRYTMDASGYRHYSVSSYNILRSTGIADPMWEFDWISFDVELKFPLTATKEEQKAFMAPLTQSGKVRRADDVYQDNVSVFDDKGYNESFEMIASAM